MCDATDKPAAFRTRVRTARASHTCCACHEAIAPGHRYRYSSGVWSSVGASFKHCLRCWAMFEAIEERAREIDPWGDCDVSLELDCGETWNDAFGDEPGPDHLAFITPEEAQSLLRKP